MKKIFLLLFIVSLYSCLTAQTVTGKLVDVNNHDLSGLQLKLYANQNIYTATSKADGSFLFDNSTSISNEKQLPTGYYVSNNYPNPFNPRTRIYITLPNNGAVRVAVYNLLGQKVRDDIDKNFSAGTSFVDLELSGLPNGLYISLLTLDEKYTVTKKLMLLYGSQHLNTSGSISANVLANSNDILNAEMKNNLLSVKIDSLVVTGAAIKKNLFSNFANNEGSIVNIGSIVVNTTTTSIPCIGVPTITYSGKNYNTVQIGTQCWLKENLDIGKMIQGTDGQINNSIIEKYCYNDDQSNCDKYGGLYQWAEAVQYMNGATDTTLTSPSLGNKVQGICPNGWHIPTKSEFLALSALVNDDSLPLKDVNEGTGTSAGTNTTGFTALLGGDRNFVGLFKTMGYYTYFWSSTEYDNFTCSYMALDYGYNNIYFYEFDKKSGYNVRCIKD